MRRNASPEIYRHQLVAYRKARPAYAKLALRLARRIAQVCDEIGLYPIVQARAKSIESLLAKLERERWPAGKPLDSMSDLCGVRVILHTRDEVERLHARLRQEFLLKPIRESRARRTLGAHAYLSPRFQLRLRGNGSSKRSSPAAELQLRTLAEHAWADVHHELGYRNDFQLPERWRHEFDHAGELLRDCDRRFQQIGGAIATYERGLDAYMSGAQLAALRRRLEMLLSLGRRDSSLVHQLIRVHLAQDDLISIAALFARNRRLVERRAAAVRDVGVAFCRLHAPGSRRFRQGVSMLRRAIKLDPRDVDALCSLGGALRRAGRRRAADECYRRAHLLDPTHPYPLGNHLAERLVRSRDLGLLASCQATIHESAERCRRQIEAGINLPWAFFDLGLFHFYLGDPQEGLRFYSRGIAYCPHAWMIASTAKPIRALRNAGVPLGGLEALDRLLKIAWWLRATKHERRTSPLWTPPSHAGQRPATPIILVIRDTGVRAGDPLGPALRHALRGIRGSLVLADVDGRASFSERKWPRGLRLAPYADRRSASVSASEPLNRCFDFWQGILSSGSTPSSVSLIVFDGSPTASTELAIAMGLGARVALIGASARSLWSRPLWRDGWCASIERRRRHAPMRAIDETPLALREFLARST